MIIKVHTEDGWQEFETDRVAVLMDDRSAIAGIIQQRLPNGEEAYLMAMAGEKDLAGIMGMLDEGIPQTVISIGVK